MQTLNHLHVRPNKYFAEANTFRKGLTLKFKLVTLYDIFLDQ